MAEHAVSKAGSAKEVWDHFDSTYKANSNTRLFMLLQNLNTIKKHPAEPLAKYFARARAIKSDLEAVEQEIPEAQITLAVLSGLPKDYAVVKTVLLITSSKRALELIHVDVCGPLQVPSRGGAKYIATFLDDYSKLSIVRTIPQKSGVAQAMQEVLQMLETRSGNKLQTARTDRGNEHLNDATSAFFKAKGVTHQTIPPYTPQHKGAAERINRTLMERTWAMLKDAKLSDNMWAEAVTTANYIRNRSPISQNAKTPWEAFSGKRPDVSNMRVLVEEPQSVKSIPVRWTFKKQLCAQGLIT
ncbi:hypothetical protein WJX79_004176 [Trebouxia sp. C0005]